MSASPWPWDTVLKRVADMMKSGYGGQTPPIGASANPAPMRRPVDPAMPDPEDPYGVGGFLVDKAVDRKKSQGISQLGVSVGPLVAGAAAVAPGQVMTDLGLTYLQDKFRKPGDDKYMWAVPPNKNAALNVFKNLATREAVPTLDAVLNVTKERLAGKGVLGDVVKATEAQEASRIARDGLRRNLSQIRRESGAEAATANRAAVQASADAQLAAERAKKLTTSTKKLTSAKARKEAFQEKYGTKRVDAEGNPYIVVQGKNLTTAKQKQWAKLQSGYTSANNNVKSAPTLKGKVDTPEKIEAGVNATLDKAGIDVAHVPPVDAKGRVLQFPMLDSMTAASVRDEVAGDLESTRTFATPPDSKYHREWAVTEGDKMNAPFEASTRQEWVEGGTNPIDDLQVTDIENMKRHPESYAKNLEALRQYPVFQAFADLPDDEFTEKAVDFMASNLEDLYNNVDEKHINRSSYWYDGANKIVNLWAQKYKLTPAQVAGVIAVFSPQKDWYQNVDMGRRMLEFWTQKDKLGWDGAMDGKWPKVLKAKLAEDKRKEKKAKAEKEVYVPDFTLESNYEAIRGLPFSALQDEEQKALWFRLWDEGLNSRSHPIVTPEGDFGDTVRNAPDKKGNRKDTEVAWTSYNFMSKAMSILENGDLSNISNNLGDEHKVRNFYDNMLVPNSPNGHVTMDTHAIAAALLRALAGGSVPVTQNFGGKGSSSSIVTGENGTYGIAAEAYRRLAKKLGIAPRQLQSITWEAVRGLFSDTFKSKATNVQAVDRIWEAYGHGKISLDEAREYIFKLADGIDPPTWADTPSAVELPQVIPPRTKPGRKRPAGPINGPKGNPPDKAQLLGPSLPGTLFKSPEGTRPPGGGILA